MPANFNEGWFNQYLHQCEDTEEDPTRMYWTCVGCDEVHHKDDETPATDCAEDYLPWINRNDAGLLCAGCAEKLDEYDEEDETEVLGFSIGAMVGDPKTIYGERHD